jgi:hypothetical protein
LAFWVDKGALAFHAGDYTGERRKEKSEFDALRPYGPTVACEETVLWGFAPVPFGASPRIFEE